MTKDKPKPAGCYYDWFDIKNYLDLSSDDITNIDDEPSQNKLVSIYHPDNYEDPERKRVLTKIVENFGECNILIWW